MMSSAYMVANNSAQFPVPFLRYTLSCTDCCYSSELSDNNIARCFCCCTTVQNKLWYLCSLPTTRETFHN